MTSASTALKPGKNVIILVHGGASSSRMYKDVVPLLSDKYNIVTPDLPGHGTAASKGPFTFPLAVESLTKSVTDVSTSQQASRPKVMVVGISLGGQVVLDLLRSNSGLVDAAIVSGASIHPPDDKAKWEMPRMTSDKAWVNLMMEDVALAGFQNMPALQEKSLAFTFDPSSISDAAGFPPVLVMVGQNDTAMSKRDFDGLVGICKELNGRSEGLVLDGAWHNHSIDVPDKFAKAVKEWAGRAL